MGGSSSEMDSPTPFVLRGRRVGAALVVGTTAGNPNTALECVLAWEMRGLDTWRGHWHVSAGFEMHSR
jgi:hypothetical protein